MSKPSRGVVVVAASAALAAVLAGCTGPETIGPDIHRATTTPTIAPATPAWAPRLVPGPFLAPRAQPPEDDAALRRAKEWIGSVAAPPGVRELAAAPAGAPTSPASEPACDWLVRATRWWVTDASNQAAAQDWLHAHPVSGLRVGGTMSGPGELSGLSEVSTAHADDSLQFEFAPDSASSGTVDIRVDVTIVPRGASCTSSG